MRSGIRFRPPSIGISPELAWTLERAFGRTPPSPAEPLVDPVAAARLAERVDLAARIASRIDRRHLLAELGESATVRLDEGYRAAAAVALASSEVCRHVAEVAAPRGAAVVAVKGAALRLQGVGALGARMACDIDLMVSEGVIEGLQRALVEVGFVEEAVPTAEQQLAPLHHPAGLVVELHRMMRGVRLDGRRSATIDDLVGHGALDRVEGGLGNLFVPSRDVLLGHLLVHGIAQHGSAPQSYPLFRLVADVQDFGMDCASWQRFLDRSRSWIGADVSREECTGVWRLACLLGAGDTSAAIVARGDETSSMLRHLIAAELDSEYQCSLRIRHLVNPVAGSSRGRTLLKKVRNNFWLGREEVDRLYGTPRSRLGYFGLRLWRPIDLGVQTLASLRAAWRLRRRQR